jgi:hypothetical protein
MLSAVLFGLNTQPNMLSPITSQGGVRLECGDYRDDFYRPDSRTNDARLLPLAVFGDASTAAAGFPTAPISGYWVELGSAGTAAHMESAFGDAAIPNGLRHNGIVIEIDVVIDVEKAAADDPVNLNLQSGWQVLWMEDPASNQAGTALTKLNNRIDQSRRRSRDRDRLRPI